MKKAKKWLTLLSVPHSITKYFPGHPNLARATFGLFIALFSVMFATYAAVFLNNDALILKLTMALIVLGVPQLIISFIAIKQYDKWHEAG